MTTLRTAAALALSTVLAYVINHALGLPEGASAWTFWIPNGVAVAFLVTRPVREWPVLVVVFLVARSLTSFAFVESWGMAKLQAAIADGLEVVLAATLTRKIIGRRDHIPGVREILAFVGLAVVAAPFLPSLIAADGFARAGKGEFWTLARNFYVGDSLGILIATPAVLVWRPGRIGPRPPLTGGVGEAILLGVVTLALGLFVFAETVKAGSVRPLPYLVVPLLLWGAARFGPRGGTAQVALIAVIAVALTARGYGPFADVSPNPNVRVLSLQLYLAVIAVSSLVFGALMAQRAQLEAERRRSQTLSALGELSARVAHDFNNDLTVIHGWAEDLVNRAESERDRGAAEQILRAAKRAGNLVRELLVFGKETSAEAAAIDPTELVESLEPMLRRTLTSRHELELELCGDQASVHADRHQLEVALINLVANAREAMPDGGTVTVGVRPDDSTSGASQVVLFVKDEGVGIAQEHIDRVFDPFFTTHGGRGGSGLGLTTVHRVVARIGGEVRVQSKLGRGTTFEVLLPRS